MRDSAVKRAARTAWPTRPVAPATTATREQVFTLVDAAFAQRRKQLKAALKTLAGSSEAASRAIEAAGVDPTVRGEMLTVEEFAAIAEHLTW